MLPRSRPVLKLRLTDESDAFFLYSLDLDEEDFQAVKVQAAHQNVVYLVSCHVVLCSGGE